MNSHFRNIAIWVVIALLLFALFNIFQNPAQRRPNEVGYSEFLSQVKSGTIKEVTIQGHRYSGQYINKRPFSVLAPENPNLPDRLESQGVTINVRPADERPQEFKLEVA